MKFHFLTYCFTVVVTCVICTQAHSLTQPVPATSGARTLTQDSDDQSTRNRYVGNFDVHTDHAHANDYGIQFTFDIKQDSANAHIESQNPLQLAAAANLADSQAFFDRLEQPVEIPVITQAPGECSDFNPENRNLYFGDLHVHTNFSMDGFAFGTGLGPSGAYADARNRLDFVAVTDHAEFFGETLICRIPSLPGYDVSACRQLRNGFYNVIGLEKLCKIDEPLLTPTLCDLTENFIWQRVQSAAQQAYDPCTLTTFVGYEYTYPEGNRLVIFDSQQVPSEPIGYYERSPPAELWKALETVCLAEQGCQILSIPHNSNLSNGEMFSPLDLDGNPISPEEAQLRAKYETVVEIFQHKGNSECFPDVDNSDPDCAFEQVDMSFLIPPGENEASPLSFVRNGLKEGLRLQVERPELGVNPFQFGFIGSTDTHNATPGKTDETQFVGHAGIYDDTAGERLSSGRLISSRFNPGGLTGVWAPENTRPEIFAALQRRETYATSGTKIAVRFFGGWDFPADICDQADLPALGYANGVPMGGMLPAPTPEQFQPSFVIQAKQDPASAPLQKIQIIRGWTDFGTVRESVLTVLDIPEGTAELCVVWTDTEFNGIEPSFYYARVFETETERWSFFDCQDSNIDCTDPGSVPPEFSACCSDPYLTDPIQERAWTSPIWYNPQPQ